MSSRQVSQEKRSECAIAGVLDLLGDRWSLLIVRDLWLRGRLRFQDFASMVGQESIATNILAARLRRLEEGGVIQKQEYQDHPRRFVYELTSKGVDLVPVLKSMAQWGVTHIPGTRGFV